jgi:prophage antirepressor-like protein
MTDQDIRRILDEIRNSGALCASAPTTDDGLNEFWFERKSTIKALGLDDPTDPLRDVIDEALDSLAWHIQTAKDGTQELWVRFFELGPAVFIFSEHPAAKRWQNWYATEVFPSLQRRETLNRIRPGLGDELADIR